MALKMKACSASCGIRCGVVTGIGGSLVMVEIGMMTLSSSSFRTGSAIIGVSRAMVGAVVGVVGGAGDGVVVGEVVGGVVDGSRVGAVVGFRRGDLQGA
jgi:hypothetical protein